MSGDQINATFELLGSWFTWANVIRVYTDKGYAGVYVPAILFFWSWGVWNLFYYPSLGQTWSFWAGVSLNVANAAWLAAMMYYGRKQ